MKLLGLLKSWKRILLFLSGVILFTFLLFYLFTFYMSPTRILVVNALKAQQADIVLSNDHPQIKVDCVEAEEMGSLAGYDAVIIYARRLFLTPEQEAEVKRVAEKGVPVYTKTLRSNDFVENHNLSEEQIATLQEYFDNENRQNYRNGLRFLRYIATPQRWGDQGYDKPIEVLKDMYYHREYGQYFKTHEELTQYLKERHLYHQDAQTLALISGITFPMEGNREHVDTLITMLTQRGFNVYPMTCSGKKREKMLHQLKPDAVVYMAMGRLGNDTLIQWMQEKNIALFCPYPLSQTHEEWMNQDIPMASGSKNARIVIPEIDGGTAPFCIATQNPNKEGYHINTAETERCEMLVEHICRSMSLRQKKNSEKRIAIGYFKRPGKDALLASGMEVIPSMYNLLKRLQQEGYNVNGLPSTLEGFAKAIKTEGLVLGSYAKGAQEEYLKKGHPLWFSRQQYEQWAKEILPAEKYQEVVNRYGEAPGELLAKGDSIAIACVRYGNVLLFPQPRPALGDDDFKLVHGVEVAPPHSYLAPYLYLQKGFQADALIHFGTHGNLEYTPGRDAGMRPQDWSQQLVGPTPHFYYYTTSNIGEAIIAKRRSNAVLLTYLTPPYAESGMRQKYNALHNDIHKLREKGIVNSEKFATASRSLKQRIVKEGLHRTLGIDSIVSKPLTHEELERIDSHVEELMNEKMQGSYYTLGQPYTEEQLNQTARAMNNDASQWPRIKQLLTVSTQAEINNMVRALNGGTIAPAPGGDPILNDNVLPTGRNMFSINPDNTPDPQAWEDGKRLAEQTIAKYRQEHGEYPRKVSYTFWAGEFIATGGATIAQALWMLGVEPERDSQGRIGALRLVPAKDLGRPRINVMIQISGQLRDIADSRLKLITEAIQMASAAEKEDSNYVREGTLAQEKELIEKGIAPQRARELSTLRVFGPVNNGYSTGMMNYIERSGSWSDKSELVDGYLNNMCAAYGDEVHWGMAQRELFAAALQETDVTIQPRQSNTWGPISLDHVYEFTGGLSMAVKALTGKEPDALMADYRNRQNRRIQGVKEAIDIEVRTTLLNPNFVRERMKGDEGTAQMFGETFRNIFGWSVTRSSALDPQLYDELYQMYVADEQQLGIREYFQQKNPAAYQAMTATMLESARKGYWKPSETQLKQTAQLHAEITKESGAACTDFVCNNASLQVFIEGHLSADVRQGYNRQMTLVKSREVNGKVTVLEKGNSRGQVPQVDGQQPTGPVPMSLLIIVILLLLVMIIIYLRKRNGDRS
jgi:cobaltochelatase CobN